jgi:hypothetical protein
MKDLFIDKTRIHTGRTAIFVRAKDAQGNIHNADLHHLTKQSLLDYLRSRDGEAEHTVLLLLGHPTVEPPEQPPAHN